MTQTKLGYIDGDGCWSRNVLVMVSAILVFNIHYLFTSAAGTNMTVTYFFYKDTPILDVEVQVVNYRCEILS